MYLPDLTLTAGLADWLEQSAAPRPPHQVRQVGGGVQVLRHDGSELSAPEQIRVRGLLAAHAVEPLAPKPKKK